MTNLAMIKELFFFVGSLAGMIGMIRPILEDRYKSDKAKIQNILEIISEKDVLNIYNGIWQSYRISCKPLDALYRISYEFEEKLDSTNFSGPLKAIILAELNTLNSNYDKLREIIQVPYWNPKQDESGEYYRELDRQWFYDRHDDYVKNVDAAKDTTSRIRESIRNLQAIRDIHFFECYIPFYRLKKRIVSVTAFEKIH